ncbi:MAG: peptide chain release factor N(5)-glutamine methyltransferase [Candidatus Omnitrophica bacterium]|nr:peptide chain release factor N(5)-glutamine methyltransferase [Candidatus Omnitrophota bacterium]
MHEAELLFTEVLNCGRPELYLNKDLKLSKGKGTLISDVLKRRALGEPLQYILGKSDFYGLQFKVTPDCLIPRPETEILVETARKYPAENILELGTGSGCIAVSLAKSLTQARITATDISDKALAVAKENALIHKVNIDFIKADLFDAYGLTPNTYGLIVSNPPYIASGDIETLQPEVRNEPRVALDGGADGLEIYRRISASAAQFLVDAGHLIVEMGFGQAQDIIKIFKKTQRFEIIDVVKDYNNIERVIVAQKKVK